MKNNKCPKCQGKGWFFVNEWIGNLQGRKDCDCGAPPDYDYVLWIDTDYIPIKEKPTPPQSQSIKK